MTEDGFLRAMIDGDATCSVYLQNGIKLDGRLVANDQHCVFLRAASDGNAGHGWPMLIMKSAISTIVPDLKSFAGKPSSRLARTSAHIDPGSGMPVTKVRNGL